jgi:hypothetical protein
VQGHFGRWWNRSKACTFVADMLRSLLIGVVLAGVLAGCSVGGRSGAGSSSSTTLSVPLGESPTAATVSVTDKARAELVRIRLHSSSHIPTISGLRCAEHDRVIVCHGVTDGGDAAVAKFRAFAGGSLGLDGSGGGAECVGWGNAKDQAWWEYHSHHDALRCLAA